MSRWDAIDPGLRYPNGLTKVDVPRRPKGDSQENLIRATYGLLAATEIATLRQQRMLARLGKRPVR